MSFFSDDSSEGSSSSTIYPVFFPDAPDGLTEEECQTIWERRNDYYGGHRERRLNKENFASNNRNQGVPQSNVDDDNADDLAASLESMVESQNMANDKNSPSHQRYRRPTSRPPLTLGGTKWIVPRFPRWYLMFGRMQRMRRMTARWHRKTTAKTQQHLAQDNNVGGIQGQQHVMLGSQGLVGTPQMNHATAVI